MSYYNDIKKIRSYVNFWLNFLDFLIKILLAWYSEAIGVKADAELGSVDKFWFVWVGWIFYWSILVFNGAVFV